MLYHPAPESQMSSTNAQNANAKKDTAWLAVMSSRVHGYCFSHFNYNDEIEAALQACGADYLVYGHEICPTTQRPHLQGYVYWKNKKQGSALVKQFPGASWRVARGNAASNHVYCTKKETGSGAIVLGEMPMDQTEKGRTGGEATKEKWKAVLRLARAGDFAGIEEEWPDLMFNAKKKIVDTYNDFMADSVVKEHDGEMPGVWIIGPAGAGKSATSRQMAVEHYRCEDPYVKPCNNYWWTNYKFQDTVILDDMDPTCDGLSHDFKTWIDRYKTNVRIHHGMLTINPRNFIVTSQYEIATVFKSAGPEVVEAMERRFPTVIRMEKSDGDEIRHRKRQRLETAQEVFGDEPL